jgi:hypothetical protein
MCVLLVALIALAMATAVFGAPVVNNGTTEIIRSVIDSRRHGAATSSLMFRARAELGVASFYHPNVGDGSCGVTYQNHEMVLALPRRFMQRVTWPTANCNRHVHDTRADGAISIVVKIVDTCAKCEEAGYDHVRIDLSEGAFNILNHGDMGQGRKPMSL